MCNSKRQLVAKKGESDELNRKWWPANWFFVSKLGKTQLEFFEIPIITKFPELPSGGGGRLVYILSAENVYTQTALLDRCSFSRKSWHSSSSARLFFFSCLVPEFLSRGRPWIMCQGDEHTNSHFQFSNPPLHQLLLAAKLLFCSHDRVSCVVCVIKIAKWHACKWKNSSQSGLKSTKKSHFLF